MAFGFTNAQQTRFGIKGGLNLSTVVGGEVENTKTFVGFHVGGFAEINIVEKFFIQPELLFSAQGTKVDGPFEDGDIKLNYLNIPEMLFFLQSRSMPICTILSFCDHWKLQWSLQLQLRLC